VRRLPVRVLLAASTSALVALLGAGPAAAHVTVQPPTATQGGFSALTFRVPTERPDASTTRLEVTFPAEQPLAFFSVKPHAGWTYRVEKARLPEPLNVGDTTVTEAVRKVTWTAAGAASAIKPGEYDEFSVSVGFLPEAERMVFKAVQTYDSGEVVRWIEEAAEGAEEPERPAPVLQLEPAEAEGASAAAGTQAAAVTPVAAGSDRSDGLARALSVTALALALLGTALGGFALGRRRSRPNT
jgi:periplasmic copper chaperone A